MQTITIQLPPEAPVMVLPEAVLFPGAVMPLHIFEPRYRAMLEWALEHDRMFCVAMMKPGIREAVTEDQFFHTVGAGLVSASVTRNDGTSNLMLQGIARVRITGFSRREPFRIARIDPLPSVGGDTREAVELARNLRERCATIQVNASPLPASFLKILAKLEEPGALADAVAQALVADAMERQELLEEDDALLRLHALSRIIQERFGAAQD
jgi:Lon protease-like protein